jgi:hypothetical protein
MTTTSVASRNHAAMRYPSIETVARAIRKLSKLGAGLRMTLSVYSPLGSRDADWSLDVGTGGTGAGGHRVPERPTMGEARQLARALVSSARRRRERT